MADRWWVLHEDVLHDALRRAHDGDDPGIVLLELDANSDHEAAD